MCIQTAPGVRGRSARPRRAGSRWHPTGPQPSRTTFTPWVGMAILLSIRWALIHSADSGPSCRIFRETDVPGRACQAARYAVPYQRALGEHVLLPHRSSSARPPDGPFWLLEPGDAAPSDAMSTRFSYARRVFRWTAALAEEHTAGRARSPSPSGSDIQGVRRAGPARFGSLAPPVTSGDRGDRTCCPRLRPGRSRPGRRRVPG